MDPLIFLIIIVVGAYLAELLVDIFFELSSIVFRTTVWLGSQLIEFSNWLTGKVIDRFNL